MDLSIAICDDDQYQAVYLGKVITAWAGLSGYHVKTHVFPSGEALLFAEEDTAYEIVLLDIQMEGMDGVCLAKKLREDGGKMQILFVTGYPDFMAEGYEVGALHYLMKPVSEQKLYEVLDRAVKNLRSCKPPLILETDDAVVRVEEDSIRFVEAFAHRTQLHTAHGIFSVKKSIGELEETLSKEAFFRCHRSYLIRLGAVSQIKGTEILLDGGAVVPLSRRLLKQANQAFIRYFRGGFA